MSDYRGEPGTIIDFIQRDHRVIKGLLDRFDTAPLHEWGKFFQEFVDYAIRHEVAEAEVVLPVVRATVEGSDGVVDDCLLEQEDIEVRLSAMEDLDPTTPEFRNELSSVRDLESAHATHEEQVILPMLRGQHIADLTDLAKSYDAARAVAPGHPLASEAPPGKLPAGTVAALTSRLRSLIGRGEPDG